MYSFQALLSSYCLRSGGHWAATYGPSKTHGEASAAGIVCVRLGTGLGLNIPDRSLRPVRNASSLEIPLGQPYGTLSIRDTWALPAGATPTLRWLAVRILDDAGDDTRAPALLGCNHCLHLIGDSIRRTRPGREHGNAYEQYRRSVPMLVPFSGKRASRPLSVKEGQNEV